MSAFDAKGFDAQRSTTTLKVKWQWSLCCNSLQANCHSCACCVDMYHPPNPKPSDLSKQKNTVKIWHLCWRHWGCCWSLRWPSSGEAVWCWMAPQWRAEFLSAWRTYSHLCTHTQTHTFTRCTHRNHSLWLIKTTTHFQKSTVVKEATETLSLTQTRRPLWVRTSCEPAAQGLRRQDFHTGCWEAPETKIQPSACYSGQSLCERHSF